MGGGFPGGAMGGRQRRGGQGYVNQISKSPVAGAYCIHASKRLVTAELRSGCDGGTSIMSLDCYRGGGGQDDSLYGGHPHVEDFTASNFPDGPREVAVVEFYAPWW